MVNLWIVLNIVLFSCIGIILFFWRRTHDACQKYQDRQILVEKIFSDLQPSIGLEKNLNLLLRYFCPIVAAQTYCFYVYDPKSGDYILKAIRHTENQEEDKFLGLNYTALLKYKNSDSYVPSLSLHGSDIPEHIAVMNQGDIPVLVVPLPSREGLVHIGPVSELRHQAQPYLEFLARHTNEALHICLEMEQLRSQIEVTVASGKAFSAVSQYIWEDEVMIGTLMSLCIKTVRAVGGCFFGRGTNGTFTLLYHSQMQPEIRQMLADDKSLPQTLWDLASYAEIRTLDPSQDDYYKLPSYLAALGMESFWAAKFSHSGQEGVIGLWFSTPVALEMMQDHRIAALKILMKRIMEILVSIRELRANSQSYAEPLRIIIQIIDELNSYTVGNSELTSRFSMAVAKKLGLETEIVHDVGMAAYLSNIGVIGLSDDLFAKTGKYTELEYEIMKLHSDVGASIVETTLGNRRIASYIRSHHERTDGYGYPGRLKGDEIPVGAKIIAVTQCFVAKISGRSNREPLPFDQALRMLETLKNSQLDARIVETFLDWVHEKQINCKNENKALGPCWELRCVPENICTGCPAFQDFQKNCWEHLNNQCHLHGNECATCFVHTEYQMRRSR